MKVNTEKCDKCHSDILMGECSCGTWFEKGKTPSFARLCEKVILDFNRSGQNVMSGDHHSGSCFIFFKGNYSMCMAVRKIIEQMQIIMTKEE